jgi:hypothetical protein
MLLAHLLLLLPLLTCAQDFVADSQAIDPSFFADSTDDPFAASNPTPPTNFGLAPEFNATLGGNKTRLEFKGSGTVAYDQIPLGFGGAVGLSCGLAI